VSGGPSVSVVIPAYKAAGFIRDAIASVRAQTLAPAEIIVVDDASPDGCAEVAESLGARVVRHTVNAGPSAARNRAIALAEGEIIAFLDADDAWLPWHLELCVGALRAHPAAAMACTTTIGWDRPTPARPANPAVNLLADPTLELLRVPIVPQSAAVVRRAVLDEVGGYNETLRYSEDYELWLRIAAGHTIACVRAPGVCGRPHPNQASWAGRRMVVENAFALRHRTYLQVAAGDDPDRTRRAADAVAAALNADLHSMWYVRDAAAFDSLLGIAGRMPGTEALRKRWSLKRRYGWHLWHALRELKRRTAGT
jgi:glycosyltransferase involved in cell wall biosynthesis